MLGWNRFANLILLRITSSGENHSRAFVPGVLFVVNPLLGLRLNLVGSPTWASWPSPPRTGCST